jgi:hypothetical protein
MPGGELVSWNSSKMLTRAAAGMCTRRDLSQVERGRAH